jgi:Cu(I)/Ag(I) efflux system membrane fusion protein
VTRTDRLYVGALLAARRGAVRPGRSLAGLGLGLALAAGAVLALGCRGGAGSEAARVESGGVALAVSVDPPEARVGENRMRIELRDAQGRPVEGAELAVKVHMHPMGAMPAMGGPAGVTPLGDGAYQADFDLDMGGSWLVEIEARTPDGASLGAEGSLTVGTPGLRLAARGAGPAGEAAHAHPRPDAPGGVAPEAGGHPGEVRLDPGRLQRIGVRSAPVEQAELEPVVRAVGRVVADETALVDVALRVSGFVGTLEAGAVGARVERGQVLLTLYSPDLYAAQQEWLQALRSQRAARGTSAPDRADALVRAARNRLRLWDVADRDLDAIARAGAPLEQVPVRSPASGFVIEKNVVAGSAVAAGERLLRIAPLDRVWLEAEVYESELGLVRVGAPVTVTLPYAPGRSWDGKIAWVSPTLTDETRTTQVRIELPNPDLELRPDMYANVELSAPRGMRTLVPESAVLYAGERSFVFLDLGGGRFRPQRVEVGMRSGERVEILSGLEAGQRIVTSGTFLIASESRLRAALEQW